MLDYHKDKKADCTIAMLEVPWDEASRFGLMLVREDGSIAEFEEKPKEPRSNKASMGVYVFTWKVLREYLLLDEADAASSNDFGKDLIPRMHSDGRGLFAFPFDGYWKDVGTIESLWDANLDILNPKIDLDLSDENWKIYSNSPASPPHYLAVGARVQNSIIAEGCTVEGSLDYSVLFANVSVGKGAEVKYSIVMPGTVIEEGACVQYAIVAENTRIGARAVVGECPEDVSNRDDWGVAVVGSGLSIGAGSVVKAKTMVENDIAEGTK